MSGRAPHRADALFFAGGEQYQLFTLARQAVPAVHTRASSKRLIGYQPVGERDFGARPGAALVFGASGGLGGAIAAMLLDRGSRVAMTYRRPSAVVDDIATRQAGRAVAHQLDLTDAAACSDVVAAVAGRFGAVHTVVYAAGPLVPLVHISEVTQARFREQLDQDAVAFLNAVVPTLHLLRASQGSLVAVTTA